MRSKAIIRKLAGVIEHGWLYSAILLLTMSAISCAIKGRAETRLSTTSPNKTYTFEVINNRLRPDVSWIEHESLFNLYKNGQIVLRDGFVDSYDALDEAFYEMYPENSWVTESILRFGRNPSDTSNYPDSIAVTNKTKKNIEYLQIIAGDMLFAFDVSPNATFTLPLPRQGWLSWVGGTGKFVAGKHLPFNGVNFFHQDKLKGPLMYCISISDNGVTVNSSVMAGYNGGNKSETPNIPKSPDCYR